MTCPYYTPLPADSDMVRIPAQEPKKNCGTCQYWTGLSCKEENKIKELIESGVSENDDN